MRGRVLSEPRNDGEPKGPALSEPRGGGESNGPALSESRDGGESNGPALSDPRDSARESKGPALSEARGGESKGHYSYSVYADSAMAESFDTLRFSGPIGRLVADAQEEVIASYLEPAAGRSILDVGTGTGRAAIALARRGAMVTGVDASAEMLAVGERRAAAARVAVTFIRDDAHDLRFGDRSFDSVICLRVLMHTPDWRKALAELCRVARHSVVFDYPALRSAAALQAAARRIGHAAGVRTEPYRVFSDRSVQRALTVAGFRVARVHRQFVLPIALHKAVGSAAATTRIEGGLAALGLQRLLGSPVTVLAERCTS